MSSLSLTTCRTCRSRPAPAEGPSWLWGGRRAAAAGATCWSPGEPWRGAQACCQLMPACCHCCLLPCCLTSGRLTSAFPSHCSTAWRGAALLLKTDGGNGALEAQRRLSSRGFHAAAAAPRAAGSERAGRGLSSEEQEAANATGAAREGEQKQAGDADTMVGAQCRAGCSAGQRPWALLSVRRVPLCTRADPACLPLLLTTAPPCLQSYTTERGAETPPEAAGDTGDVPDQATGGMRNVQTKVRQLRGSGRRPPWSAGLLACRQPAGPPLRQLSDAACACLVAPPPQLTGGPQGQPWHPPGQAHRGSHARLPQVSRASKRWLQRRPGSVGRPQQQLRRPGSWRRSMHLDSRACLCPECPWRCACMPVCEETCVWDVSQLGWVVCRVDTKQASGREAAGSGAQRLSGRGTNKRGGVEAYKGR